MFHVQGHADSDLNDVGKQQAQAVKFVAKLLKLFLQRCAVVIFVITIQSLDLAAHDV